jgi:hypothetical protein
MTRRSVTLAGISALTTALTTALAMAAATPAAASWGVHGGPSRGSALARTLPAGSTPTASAAGTSISVSWAANVVAPGTPVAGYRLARYDASTGTSQPLIGTCAAVVSATTCSEPGVSAGGWRYTVRPVHGTAWTGVEGAQSAVVTVAAVTPPTIDTKPANPTNLPGATFSFSDPQSGVTFECSLDAATYATCTSTSSYSGLSSGGHTFAVRAKDANAVASTPTTYAWTIDTTAPTATDVQALNGAATTGLLETSDTLTYTYSEPIDPASIKPGWTGAAQTVTVRVHKGNGPPSNKDEITLYDSTNAVQVSPLGTVSLAQRGFLSQDLTFTATMLMTGSQIVITLGTTTNANKLTRVTTVADMVWTVATAKDPAGNTLNNAGAAVTESHPAGSDIDF